MAITQIPAQRKGLQNISGAENQNRMLDIVFIHGLGGDALNTWMSNANDVSTFWPNWLEEEFKNIGIWTLDYGASPTNWREESMPIAKLGSQILDLLSNEGLGERSLIFIVHSLGGIMVKQLLRDAENCKIKSWLSIAENTLGIAFIATPHKGANIANFLAFAGTVLRLTDPVKELGADEPRLQELHTWFLNFQAKKKLVCKSYGESRETRFEIPLLKKEFPKGVFVVDTSSAETGIAGNPSVFLPEDHLSICKPASRDSQLYQGICRFVKDCQSFVAERDTKKAKTKSGKAKNAAENQHLNIWLNRLSEECTRLPLEKLEIRPQQGQKRVNIITLPDIFVPLKATPPTKEWLENQGPNRQLAKVLAAGESGKPEAIMKLLTNERLAVVIGDPGSGKSTLINYLTWSLYRNDPENLGRQLKNRIPVRIILRQVDIPADAESGLAIWLWHALAKDIKVKLSDKSKQPDIDLSDYDLKAVIEALRQKLLEPPYGLIMLDGLDEVSVAGQRRGLLLQAVQALAAELPDTRFIVTARPYAYTDPGCRLNGFTAFFLSPFGREQRAEFINRWYEAARHRYLLQDAMLAQRITDLIERIETKQHLTELAERPLLLTLISCLHANGGRLPEDRAELYQKSVALLLYDWRQESFLDGDGHRKHLDEKLLRDCLQTLAYKSHRAQQQQKNANHSADISENLILETFKPILKKLGSDDLLKFLHEHTGILIARDQNSFAFVHRSFQEYLAMGYLTGQLEEDKLSPEVCADPLWWREVFLLAVLEQKQTPRHALGYIRDVLDCGTEQSEDAKNRLYILSALALNELDLKSSPQLTVEIRKGLVELITNPFMVRQAHHERNQLLAVRPELVEGLIQRFPNALNPDERAEAGRVLAAIGDERPGVGLNDNGWPDISWLPIPKGEVALEDNAGSFSVDDFYLAKYPVTNAQFQRFLDDPEGYLNPRWWQGLDAGPEQPVMPRWSEANHPRERVSWFEAMAFCAWLSERLQLDISLPAEWQWQQAACSGRADFDYPWGKAYQSGAANINETYREVGPHYLQRTAAVGLYPQGDSLQGVDDLSGNVWEWCLNEYAQPANKQISGSLARVVRGGSWFFGQYFARASYRGNFTPDGRSSFLGFRVCCLSPIN